jgi:hypothetical protein
MQTFLGIHCGHRDSQAAVEGLWSPKRYFEESIAKVEKAAVERDVEVLLHSSIASIHSKSITSKAMVMSRKIDAKSNPSSITL